MDEWIVGKGLGVGGFTVECGVHPTNVDEETNHGHALGGIAITKQLVAQDFAGLAAPRHGVDVEVGKTLLANLFGFVAVGEDLILVVEDGLEKVVLDILAPEGLAIVLFEMSDLADDVVARPVIVATALLTPGMALAGFGGRRGHLSVVVVGDGGHEGFFDTGRRAWVHVGHESLGAGRCGCHG